MKNEEQIREKIIEHETHINEILEMNREEWTDMHIDKIEAYLMGRKALLWVLSDDEHIEIDSYERMAKNECLCYDSTKIF